MQPHAHAPRAVACTPSLSACIFRTGRLGRVFSFCAGLHTSGVQLLRWPPKSVSSPHVSSVTSSLLSSDCKLIEWSTFSATLFHPSVIGSAPRTHPQPSYIGQKPQGFQRLNRVRECGPETTMVVASLSPSLSSASMTAMTMRWPGKSESQTESVPDVQRHVSRFSSRYNVLLVLNAELVPDTTFVAPSADSVPDIA